VPEINRTTFRELSTDEQIRALRGTRVERTFVVERAAVNEERRTVALSLSSELPYERWWGIEILDHTAASIVADRLGMGAPLLVGHDPADQVGVIESYQITGKKLRVVARFGRSARAQEIFNDVVDGIRQNTSVGYVIHDLQIEDKNTDPPTYRVTSWEPFEGSLVPIPADPTVGVGRSLQGDNAMSEENHQTRSERIASKNENPEAARIKGLLLLGDEYRDHRGPEVARKLIDEGGSVDMFLAQMRENMRTVPLATAQPAEFPGSPPISAAPSRMAAGSSRALWAFGETRREQEQNAYAAGQHLRATLLGNEQAKRWCMDHGMIRAAGGGVLSDGGAVVPTEMSNAVINLRENYGVARQECRVIPMNSDSLIVPRREGGLTSYYIGENAELTKSQVNWGQVQLTPKKLGILSLFSNELGEDAVIPFAAWLADEAALAFAEAEDDAWLNGDGTSTYGGMQGVLSHIVDGTHTAGAVDATSGHNLLGEIDATDIENLMAALPAYALPRAKFYTSAGGNALVFQRLIQAAGGLTMGDVINGPSRMSYLGHPIVISQKMPGSASTDYTNLPMILFGDMSLAAMLGSRRDISIKVDESRYLEYDQTAVRATERYHIVVHDLGDNTTGGPVVALIGN
jgi:HK97 family phage major capsid protein